MNKYQVTYSYTTDMNAETDAEALKMAEGLIDESAINGIKVSYLDIDVKFLMATNHKKGTRFD